MNAAKQPFEMLACHVPGVEAVQAQSRHRFSRHMHEQFGIGVVIQGAQKSLSGQGTVEAVAGDTITVNPGEVHDGAPVGDHGRSWKMLYFEPALVAGIVADFSANHLDNAEFANPVIHSTAVSSCVRHLFDCMTMPIMGNDVMSREELMLVLFAKVLHKQVPLPARLTPDSAGQVIARARSLMDEDPGSAITLSDLSGQASLSRFQLIRAFSKATGMTPHAYLLQRRLHLARRLIAQGVSLVDAAVNSGFADQSHMTRMFIRNFGISPGIYASAHQRDFNNGTSSRILP